MGTEVEMSNPTYGKSTGAADGQGQVRWRKTKLSAASCCLLVGIALIVVGAIIPTVIQNMILKGVEDTVRLDPDTMTDSAMLKFVNGSNWEEFYLYNVTNLYDVLTRGDKINFQEVGPIKTIRYGSRYNISWDVPNSQVKYQWLTTFEVLPESQHLLDQTIIGVNPFWFGAAATVMQKYIAGQAGQNPADPASYKPTSEFPGNFLNEQIFVTGFFGGQVLPGILPVFQDPVSSPFLTTVRASSLSTYVQFVPSFCAAANISFATVLNSWASGSPYLSAAVPDMWQGFELSSTLQSSNINLVAQNVFDKSNNYGFASAAGLAAWKKFIATNETDPTYQPQKTAIATGLSISNPEVDIPILSNWFQKFPTALPTANGGNSFGDAYQNVVTRAISGQIQLTVAQGAAAAPPTPFSKIYADYTSYAPKSWSDIGALQFGTGLIIGLQLTPTTTPLDGKGASVSDIPGASKTNPFNFYDGSDEPEPMEFTSGLAYYVKHNSNLGPRVATLPTGAVIPTQLWTDNPALLYADVDSKTFINLNIAQTNALFGLLRASSSAYGGLIQTLKPLVSNYTMTYLGARQAGAPIPNAITLATNGVNALYDQVTASPGSLLTLGGVTKSNWYAVWSYLYSYVGSELTGSLLQIDPASGLAPQNTGLFSKATVRQNLFGYTGRFGVEIPGIAGPLRDPATIQRELDLDLAQHEGREWIQDTGHRNLDTVGQYIQYEGTEAYQHACEIDDPKHTVEGVCKGDLAAASHNWRVWGAPHSLRGSGSSLQIQPFTEGDDARPRFTDLYVSEIRRVVKIEYKTDVEIKGINLRRYGLYPALINASYITPNPEKNHEMWRQQGVPDGLFSMSTYRGGYAGMASVPHWGLADPKVWAGATCDGQDCATYYDATKHETFIDIHPLTGLTMSASKRLQANFRVAAQELWTGPSAADATPIQPGYPAYPAQLPPGYPATNAPGGLNYHYNNLFKNAESIYIPYYWADIHDEIKDDDAADVRSAEKTIKTARSVKEPIRYVGIILGAVIVIAAIGVLVKLLKKKDESFKRFDS